MGTEMANEANPRPDNVTRSAEGDALFLEWYRVARFLLAASMPMGFVSCISLGDCSTPGRSVLDQCLKMCGQFQSPSRRLLECL